MCTPCISHFKCVSWIMHHQFIICFLSTANLVILAQGCAIGWLSPTLPILQSDDSPLKSGKLTMQEASWVGSISSIGSVVGTIYFGLISICLGSKNTLILCALPVTVSSRLRSFNTRHYVPIFDTFQIFWIFVMFASNAWHILAGRLIQGMTAGAFLCVQMYLADIAKEG